MSKSSSTRRLVLVLGDQLNSDASAFDGFDDERDAVWMAEAAGEVTYVRSHKARIALFLSGMRHYRDRLRARGCRVEYSSLDDRHARQTLGEQLKADLRKFRPERVVLTRPGEWRVEQEIRSACESSGVGVDVRPDRHFLCSREEFEDYAEGRKTLRMEGFYHRMRRKYAVLLDGDDPAGGKWNYDQANRETFGKSGPQRLPRPPAFSPDQTTREVIRLVEERFADHPGSSTEFDWPVTPDEARVALKDFIANRLSHFGRYQDAMWTDEPFLYHSLLSSSMNLKLLDPREVIEAAESAWRDKRVPLEAAEGFIRQVLGWREYIRGIYWRQMPDYVERNALRAHLPLPWLYWSGETEAECLRRAIGQTLRFGYAHHIQRLMVTGLFALLLGVEPKEVHRWYLAIYVDAVEWVEMPNTLGMSQYADNGLLASKPYAASGRYIQRMSNYCAACPFNPSERLGERACPFTTLYWDFLAAHRSRFEDHPRMALAVKNLDRIERGELRSLRRRADKLREDLI